MEKISKFLKTQVPAASLLIQSLVYFLLGALLFVDRTRFAALITILVLCFFALHGISSLALGLVRLPFHFAEGLSLLVSAAANFGICAFLLYRPEWVWSLLPLLLAFSSALNFISSTVTFFQYRRDASTKALRSLVGAVVSGLLTAWLLFSFWQRINFSLLVTGVFLILYGLSTFSDFLAEVIPPAYKSRLKKHIRITLPVFWASFFPHRALDEINHYFETGGEDLADWSVQKGEQAPNVEIFVHVSDEGNGTMGHVDLRIRDMVISYGGYDVAAMKLFGGLGPGVLFEHYKKDDYIAFCESQSGKTLFGFGLLMTEPELAAMEKKLADILQDAYEWVPDAHLVQEGKAAAPAKWDYGSLLYLATDARFFKFKSGSFKNYFVLGTNCVKLADTLLRASGTATVANGIISPGTYYTFLNSEFMRSDSIVITRTVYFDRSQNPPADQKPQA